MKDKSENQTSSEAAAKVAAASAFATSDDLVKFASSYFATDFPNPGRLDCPPTDTLSALVHSGESPDEKLRSHLFGCSECFKEYQSAIAVSRVETKEVTHAPSYSWWGRLLAGISLRPIPVFAGVICLVLLAFVGTYAWREYRSKHEQNVAKQEPAPVVAPSENAPINKLPSANPSAPSLAKTRHRIKPRAFPKRANQQIAPVQGPDALPSAEGGLIAMSVDLGDYLITRDGAGGGEIKFSQARTRLLISLPEGSVEGFYTVSVVGASGRTLDTRTSRSTDGKTLTATLNMQRLTPEKYWLRISREAEPPINVSIVVTDPTSVANENGPPRKNPIKVRPVKKP